VQSHSGCTRTQILAGANKDHQVVEEGREVIVERGAKLGAEPSDTGSGLVMSRRLQSHGSIVVGDSLATQKMTNCPLIEWGFCSHVTSAAELRHH
jgi:hypothetical protein